MPRPATATMTAAEFDRRVEAADGYIYRGLIRVVSPAGIALVVFMAAWAAGAELAEWIVNLTVFVMLVSTLTAVVLVLVREERAAGRFGLLCAGCGMGLAGGRTHENTIHVRKTGCCSVCAAPVLQDHPGAIEAAAREAAVPRGAPHPGAFSREDFDRRLALLRGRTGRRMLIFISMALGGLPALAGIALLPLPHALEAKIMNGGAFVIPVVLLGTMFGGRSTWRRVGLVCPACRKNPLDGRDISVVRTGICPHCSAVIIQPAA